MPPEHPLKPLPEWAVRDRPRDMEWIGENLSVFWPAATAGFKKEGRGALVVNTTMQTIPEKKNPFAYFPQEAIETGDDEDTKRLVRQYDPEHEFVVMLLKAGEHTSSYSVRVNPHEPPPEG